MIIYLAALQGVPDSLYEAAELDGANALHKFWHVTLPFISPITLFLLITAVINNFQYFTPAYVFANSQDLVSQYGPGNSLEFYAFHLYNLAFKNLQMGYASAYAWVLFVIIAVVAVIIFKSSLKWVYYDDGGNS
jgi:multiple sugar transport system permease protein